MSLQLLPSDFDDQVASAVRTFWMTRKGSSSSSQEGTRGAVISGKNMDGFIDLVRSVARHCDLPADAILTRKRDVVLPGFYRPTKNWDVLVIHRGRLLAVWEFKSQVGPSFGNNFNNRSEEAIGAAADLWAAEKEGAYNREEPRASMFAAEPRSNLYNLAKPSGDPRPPFVAWLMLLEDCRGSTSPVQVKEPNFAVSPEFKGASYAGRYRLLCERLMRNRLYDGAALMLSDAANGAKSGQFRSLSEATTVAALFREFAAKVVAAGS